MGVYDFLIARCPGCGARTDEGQVGSQIKWISRPGQGTCFRVFRVGEKLPDPLEDGLYEVEVCPECGKRLVALIKGNRISSVVAVHRD